jgi:hypothetical protein
MPSSVLPWTRTDRVAFGAVFDSADACALNQYSRNRQPRDTEQTWFGFILKHQAREEYVATELLPVSAERNDLFQLQTLFPSFRGRPLSEYLEGFEGHAFFYSRQQVTHASTKPQRWIANHFINPDDLFIAVYYSKRNAQVVVTPKQLRTALSRRIQTCSVSPVAFVGELDQAGLNGRRRKPLRWRASSSRVRAIPVGAGLPAKRPERNPQVPG